MKEQGIYYYFFFLKKALSLASERHIVNRVSPNLASFYHEGACGAVCVILGVGGGNITAGKVKKLKGRQIKIVG